MMNRSTKKIISQFPGIFKKSEILDSDRKKQLKEIDVG
jgi:hypothetical protein